MDTVLDTNFVLFAFQKKANWKALLEDLLDKALEPIILSPSVQELKMLAASKKQLEKKAAKAALKWIESGGAKVVEASGRSDKAILDFAAANKKAIVCTNDKRLKQLLTAKGVKVVCLRRSGSLCLC